MSDLNTLQDIKLEIGLMQKDIDMTDRLCAKVSESIEKLQEVNVNLVKMISLHEQKHQLHEQVERDLKDDVKELHSRITTANREMQDKMSQLENHLSDKLDSLKDELLELMRNDLMEKKTESLEKKTSTFFAEFDKYKWMVVGAALAFGWVIGNVNLSALATIFK